MKLVDRIKLLDPTTNNSNNNEIFLDFEKNNGEKSELNINTHITLVLLKKTMESIQSLYNIYIKSKYIKIITYKIITQIVLKFEKIYANLWDLYYLLYILTKSYISLLLDIYIQKL